MNLIRPILRPLSPIVFAAATAMAATALARSAMKVIPNDKAGDAQQVESAAADISFLKVSDENGRVALQVASRTCEPAGDGPTVTLVGVVHVGDADYYRDLQKALEGYDVVLYESVTPAGTGGAGGENDEQRIESTAAAVRFIASVAELQRDEQGELAVSMQALGAFAAAHDARLGEFVRKAATDAWGQAITFERDGSGGYRAASLGADGAEGGSGADADIIVTDADAVPVFAPPSEDGIQAQLAGALGLTFQLKGIDYDHPHWRCSDMSIDAVQRAMERHGSDFTVIEDALAGTSLPAQVARVMLGLVRFADTFLDGAVSDMIKVLLIEMLGDQSIIDASLAQVGEGFAEVLIDQRNQVVVNDLEALIEREGDGVRSVAILYGAGHMPDLVQRLSDQLSYELTEVTWMPAIEVDTKASAISQAELNRLRLMTRRMMRQMAREMARQADDAAPAGH